MAVKNNPESTQDTGIVKVTVDGVELEIDSKKLMSWKYMVLLKQSKKAVVDGDQDGIVFSSIDIVEFLLGDQVEKIIEHLGGDDAAYNDVVAFYRRIPEAVSEAREDLNVKN